MIAEGKREREARGRTRTGELERAFEERPWQPKVIERALSVIRDGSSVFLNAPTGSGKSLIALSVGRELIKEGFVNQIYVGVRTINEITPFERDIRQFFGNNTLSYTAFLGKKRACPFYAEGDEHGTKLCEACLQSNSAETRTSARRRVDSLKVSNLIKFEGYTLDSLQKTYVLPDLKQPDDICLFHSLRGIDSEFTLLTYPYIFSEYVRDSIDLEEKLKDSLLIIDEAHNLDEISSMLERRITMDGLKKVESNFAKIADRGVLWIDPKDKTEIINSLKEISNLILEFVEPDGKPKHKDKAKFEGRIKSDVSEGLKKIRRTSSSIQSVRAELLKRGAPTGLIQDPFSSLMGFFEALESEDDSLDLFSEGVSSLVLRVVDPSVILSVLNKSKGLMLMSGTLPSQDYIRKVWSLGERSEFIDVERDFPAEYESKFPPEAKRFKVVRSVTTSFTQRTESLWEKYGAIIEEACSSATKHVLVCCPSYQVAEKISRHLESPFILEQKSTTHAEISARLRDPEGPRYILLSVARGKLLEGVEFTSSEDGLSLIDTVVIAGIPYTVPDEYHDYRTEKIMGRLGIKKDDPGYKSSKFEYFMRQPALVTIRQAIGRSIRSPEDYATIVLADSRFLEDSEFWTRGIGITERTLVET